ncbi:TRAP transporter large permease [Halalkalicoccus tibetensis]
MSMIFLRLEIAFAIGITGVIWVLIAGEPLTVVASRSFSGMNSFTLLAIPFFILAGELMNKVGISDTLIKIANMSLGRMRGGLAQANIGSSMLFAGISGSAIADVAALGTVFVPRMSEEGFDRDFAAAVTAASSVIGPIIPPSNNLIVYGAVTGVSIGGLFAGAIIPGILLGVTLMVMVYIFSYWEEYPKYKPTTEEENYPKLVGEGVVAITMPVIIIYGIIGGFFTVTEAAAVACAYAILLGIFLQTLSISDLYSALYDSLDITAQIFTMIGFSLILAWMLARRNFPTIFGQFIQDLGVGQVGFLLLIATLLLFIGTWLSITATIIMLAPTLDQLATALGIHELQFGVIMVLALGYGLITPPLGVSLFAVSSVGDVKVWPVAKRVIPFYICFLIVLLLVILIPELTLYLPRSWGLA